MYCGLLHAPTRDVHARTCRRFSMLLIRQIARSSSLLTLLFAYSELFQLFALLFAYSSHAIEHTVEHARHARRAVEHARRAVKHARHAVTSPSRCNIIALNQPRTTVPPAPHSRPTSHLTSEAHMTSNFRLCFNCPTSFGCQHSGS